MNARSFLADLLQIDAAAIGPDFCREQCAAWDSFAHLNLMLALEKEFRVPLNDQTIQHYQSLAAIEPLFAVNHTSLRRA